MKRMCSVLLCMLLLMMSLTGCMANASAEVQTAGVNCYYQIRNVESLNEDTAVRAEVRTIEPESLDRFLATYIQGPKSDALISPFPEGVKLLTATEERNEVLLVLSGEYFMVPGVQLALANCCLCKTVCDYTGAASVTLRDADSGMILTVSPEDFLLNNTLNEELNDNFTLYFPSADGRWLVAENREATLSVNEPEAVYVLRQLQAGPENNKLTNSLPKGTQILSVKTEGTLCTVNLSKEFIDNRSDEDIRCWSTLYSIVNSLTELRHVDSVVLEVEGKRLSSYGAYCIEDALERYADCIGPVHTASGELDGSLFVLTEQGETFGIPTRVKQNVSQPAVQALLQKLLTLEPPKGFKNFIPFGTEVISATQDGTVCYVDLSREFLNTPGTEEQRIAIWSVVASLTAMDGVESVMLSIDGDTSMVADIDLTKPLTTETMFVRH